MFTKKINYIGFDDRWFRFVGIIVTGFLIPLVFFGVEIKDGLDLFYMHWIQACIFCAIYWTMTRAVLIAYRKKYPNFNDSKKRILWSLIVIISSATIFCYFTYSMIHNIGGSFQVEELQVHTPFQVFSASYICIVFYMAVYESIWYHSQLQKSILTQELVKVAHVQSQLDGLRNQVNPHFLFNSLNTLNHIVESEDKHQAKRFIGKLSTVYRYILDSREESTIDLREELDFVQAYADVQNERFMDNLNIEINIEDKYLQKKIIPLSLQLLIENAIKHNVISTKKPLNIKIDIDGLNQTLRVTNNLQLKSRVLHSTKVGLKNITDRYHLLSEDKEAEVHVSEDSFQVILPLL